MRYLRVKNWEQFQHYKDRDPPWIKMHRTLLSDYEFARLQDASKAHLMLIWLFASQFGGRIPDDPEFLRDKLSLKKPPDLKAFVDQGLLIPEQDASKPLQQDASNVLSLARSREAEDINKEEAEKNARAKGRALPEWVPEEPWKAWLEVRSKVKAPNTERALQLAISTLAKLRDAGEDPKAVLENATLRGWKGLFAVPVDKNSTPDYSGVIARIAD